MGDRIQIRMMNNFTIYVNEQKADHLMGRTRKGAALMQYLILNRGESVTTARLMGTLWTEESANPENALKTLVSRLRAQLNQISEGLGSCIVADRGAYHWKNLPGMEIDLYEIEDLLERLLNHMDMPDVTGELYERLLTLYQGDLLRENQIGNWAQPRAEALRGKFLSAMYSYVELLKMSKQDAHIVEVCRAVLDVDNFNERMHTELMTALMNTGRSSDALAQYQYMNYLNYQYRGVRPDSGMEELYRQIARTGRNLDDCMETIRCELLEGSEQHGALVCEYAMFKDMFNLQMRNLERLGMVVFLGVIMVGSPENPMDSMRQDSIMNGLLEILRTNLRKGDTVARFSPTIFALLLPTVNYTSGNMALERIKRLFYAKYPNSGIPFNYRMTPVSDELNLKMKQLEHRNPK